MSELREPLEHITTCYKAFGEAFCALVDAVGVMEPEDTDAPIRKLRKRLADIGEGGGVVIQKLHRELAEAQATIRDLRDTRGRWEQLQDWQRDSWERQCPNAEQELTEAKAETERLRKERDSAELKLETLQAIDERICADAEIGQLVREMPNDTGLCRIDGQYAATVYEMNRRLRMVDRALAFHPDPAKALHSIQASGDDNDE